MNRCTDCGHLFEDGEESRWEENHGFDYGRGEQFSGCPVCGEGYVEVQPCAICGSYPGEEYDYDDERLPNGGICAECFDAGIRERFDMYLDSEDAAYEFYIGEHERNTGSAYSTNQIIEILRREYMGFAQMFPDRANAERKKFIMDGDPDYFGEWLAKASKK